MEKEIQELFIKALNEDMPPSVFSNEILILIKNTPQTIEKNKNVLKDLFNECKNVDEFIKVVAENFELK